MFVNWILRLSWEIYIRNVYNIHGDEWDTREKWVLLTARYFFILTDLKWGVCVIGIGKKIKKGLAGWHDQAKVHQRFCSSELVVWNKKKINYKDYNENFDIKA